jgi:hypothetical protein
VHVHTNLDRTHRAKLAEMSVSSKHDAVDLHRLRRIGFARDHDDARLWVVGEYERELGIAGERKWTR